MILKFLKAWKNPADASQTCDEGKSYDIDDSTKEGKTLIGQLLVDGTAEKDASPAAVPGQPRPAEDLRKMVGDEVKSGLEAALKDDKFAKSVAGQVHEIAIHDKSDDDPFHGYLPGFSGKINDATSGQKEYALGLFATDILRAGQSFSHSSERLLKSLARSEDMVEKALDDGSIHSKAAVISLVGSGPDGMQKAAGDGLRIHVDEEVGALMPPALSLALFTLGDTISLIRPRATTMPVGLAGVELPKPKNYDHSSSTIYGGARAYWIGEDAQLTETKPKMEVLRLTPHGLAALAYASHKTMRGAPATFIGGYLLPIMGEAVTFAEEDAFINGTGAGQPLGLMNSPCKVAITAETGQAAATIVVENIDKMEQRLRVKRGGGVAFLYNRSDSMAQLRALKREVGTGGQIERLFSFGGFANPTGSSLDNIPILDTEFVQALGTEGDLILTDLSQYIVADDRGGAEIAQSIHLKFDYGQSAFRLIKYVDGQPENSSAFTTKNGTNTRSSILTLATR